MPAANEFRPGSKISDLRGFTPLPPPEFNQSKISNPELKGSSVIKHLLIERALQRKGIQRLAGLASTEELAAHQSVSERVLGRPASTRS